mgnify:CR=1 FL=1
MKMLVFSMILLSYFIASPMTQYQSKYSDESENEETIFESRKLNNPKRIVATTGEPEIESNPKVIVERERCHDICLHCVNSAC